MYNHYFNFYYNIEHKITTIENKTPEGETIKESCTVYTITNADKNEPYFSISYISCSYYKYFITVYKKKVPKKDLPKFKKYGKDLFPVKNLIDCISFSMEKNVTETEELLENLITLPDIEETEETIVFPFSFKEDFSHNLKYRFESFLEDFFTQVRSNYQIILMSNSLFKYFNVSYVEAFPKTRKNGKPYFEFMVKMNSEFFSYLLKRDTREPTWYLYRIETITSKKTSYLTYHKMLKCDLSKFITGYDYAVEFSESIKRDYGEILENTLERDSKYTFFTFGVEKDRRKSSDKRLLNEKLEFNLTLNNMVRNYLKQLPNYDKIKDIKF